MDELKPIRRRIPRLRVPGRNLSLRTKTLLVVMLLLSTPLLMVYLSVIGDRSAKETMRQELTSASVEVLNAFSAPQAEQEEALDSIAWSHSVWMRVIDGEGHNVAEFDYEEGVSGFIGDLFFGPDGAPSLRVFDETLPPLISRKQIKTAAAGNTSLECLQSEGGTLYVCSVAVAVSTKQGDVQFVHLTNSSRRAIRALYDVRYLLMKLTLSTLLAALPVAFWLSRRMLTPIEQLREDVLLRARYLHTAQPLRVERDDEFGDLALAFNEVLLELEHRNQAYATFVADLAHELKNPVAAVRAVAESMEQSGDLHPNRVQRWSRVVGESSKKLDSLVTCFLELARAETGLPLSERSRVNLSTLMSGIVDVISKDNRFHGVKFLVDVPSVEVDAVQLRLEAALSNLLVNAASFAGDDGVVEVTGRVMDDEVGLTFEDTGPGVPDELKELVFDRFFTTRRESGGTGLGLAMTKAVVESHGGRVGVGDRVDGGASFQLWLPLSAPALK